ncbi:hypothetical protein GALMADRAFT_224043 [Galerina marginata CBS 339.88]|uniref:Uncharacterized protein n=1 Tax=Galerina marginata (strain CBS 339.88) TaxID=685588 RepID=A0A067T6N6_GALM3|nr:hypothetical protein GALMADRAFT_224043 [Galerina marginata CBS 339.88]
MEMVKLDIIERYPELFSGNNDKDCSRLKLAINLVHQQHSNARGTQKKRIMDGRQSKKLLKEKENGVQKQDLSTSQVQPSQRMEPATPCNGKEFYSQQSDSSPSIYSSHRQAFQPTQNSSSFASSSHTLAAASSDYFGPSSQSSLMSSPGQSFPIPSASQLTNTSSPRIKHSPYKETSSLSMACKAETINPDPVFLFLDSCIPSMAHLFESFVAFGCSNEKFLLGLSKWTPERIDEYLKRFSNSCDVPLQDMDIFVLNNQLQNYIA